MKDNFFIQFQNSKKMQLKWSFCEWNFKRPCRARLSGRQQYFNSWKIKYYFHCAQWGYDFLVKWRNPGILSVSIWYFFYFNKAGFSNVFDQHNKIFLSKRLALQREWSLGRLYSFLLAITSLQGFFWQKYFTLKLFPTDHDRLINCIDRTRFCTSFLRSTWS